MWHLLFNSNNSKHRATIATGLLFIGIFCCLHSCSERRSIKEPPVSSASFLAILFFWKITLHHNTLNKTSHNGLTATPKMIKTTGFILGLTWARGVHHGQPEAHQHMRSPCVNPNPTSQPGCPTQLRFTQPLATENGLLYPACVMTKPPWR